MLPSEEFQALLRADAREVAERSLRYKFGRLSNARILRVLRPVAAKASELRTHSDSELLDLWFAEFTSLRRENAIRSRGAESSSAG